MNAAHFLDRLLSSVSDAFTPEVVRALVTIELDADLRSHVDALARKANDGTISDSEDAEYKALIEAADLISVLQLKARRFLAKNSA